MQIAALSEVRSQIATLLEVRSLRRQHHNSDF